MRSRSLGRRIAAGIGVAAIAAMVGLTAACGGGGEKAPEETTTTTTTTTTSSPAAPAPAPTEKSINPTGGNLFTPPIQVPGPQTPVPGNEPGNKPGNK